MKRQIRVKHRERDEGFSKKERYLDLREKWKHEDEMTNRRITWLYTGQVFFLGAQAFSLKIRYDLDIFKIGSTPENISIFLFGLKFSGLLLALIGLFTTVSLHRGIRAASDAMTALRLECERLRDECPSFIPKVSPSRSSAEAGKDAARDIPMFFSLAWVIVVAYEFTLALATLPDWEIVLTIAFLFIAIGIIITWGWAKLRFVFWWLWVIADALLVRWVRKVKKETREEIELYKARRPLK